MSFKKLPLTSEYINIISQSQQPQKLYKLNCTSKNIQKIDTSIKKYNKIRCLILDFNYLQKIQNLNALFDLRQLNIQGNLIIKIQGLQTCKNLTTLNLANNKIQKIQKISHLMKLQNLNISKNKLQKIANLQTFKQLKILNLSFNCITSLQSLPAFSKLQSLILNNNKIQKISANAFSNSQKLLRLNISNNNLTQTSFISKLLNIQYLNLQNNHLKSFQCQNTLKYLQQLILQNNQLDNLPMIGQYFPQLVILNINKNMFCSQHNFITILSDNQMLTEMYFQDNPIQSKEFQQTLYHLYKFDRINQNKFSEPGTKYLESINQIQNNFKINKQFKQIQDDQDDRKLKMSGFYNDQLENRMTGIKPHRAVSPATKKAKAIINDNLTQIQKSFKQFIQNDKRINNLRQIYQKICQQHHIQKPIIQPLPSQQQQIYLTQQKTQSTILSSQSKRLITQQKLTQLRQRNDNNQKILLQNKKQKQSKWAQLKAKTKQKNFNIRKSRTKDNSLSRISADLQKDKQKVSTQLMKTQVNPQRPSLYGSNVLETAIKSGKTFYRPNSQKKLSKNM